MGKSKIILGFDGEYKFLGNDYPCSVVAWGVNFPSVDHAYQAGKTTSQSERELIRSRPTALAAWQAGQALRRHRHWHSERVKLMISLLKIKFADPELKGKLLATGGAELVFIHYKDSWWGRLSYHTPPLGGNRLGIALQDVRKFYQPFKRNILV